MSGNGKLFISHTHTDNEQCEPLLAALDAWQADYWFDREQLSAGQEFPPLLWQAIEARDIFLRVLTRAAVKSDWMAREVTFARSLHGQRSPRRVINLRLQSEYLLSPQEQAETVIDATVHAEVDWLRALRQQLGIPPRGRPINRRALIGGSLATGVGLCAVAAIGKRLLFADAPVSAFSPSNHAVLPTPDPTMPPVRWRYRYALGSGPVHLAQSGDTLLAAFCLDGSSQAADETNEMMALARLESISGSLQWMKSCSLLPLAADPVIADDTVYLLGSEPIGDQYQGLNLMAVDITTGSERWRSPSLANLVSDFSAELLSATVAVSKSVVVARWEETLAAIDITSGALRWQQTLSPSDPTDPQIQRIVSAPVIANATIYLGLDDGSVAAYALLTGNVIWRSQVAAARLSNSACVTASMIYIGSEDGYLYALDAATGALRWKQALTQYVPPADTHTLFVTSAPTMVDGILYIGSGAFQGTFYNRGGSLIPDTEVVDDNLYALDAATGRVVWSVHPSLSAFPYRKYPLSVLARPGVRATPLVDGDTIYATSYVSLSTAPLAAGSLGSSATMFNVEYLDTLYALDRASGHVRWTYTTTGRGDYPSEPMLTPTNLVVFGSTDNLVLALKPNAPQG